MTQAKRPLLNSEIKRDWVVITSLALGATTSYNSVTSSFFVDGNQQFGSYELLAASIDSIIGTAITFFLLVAILGSIRRRRSKSDEEVTVLESETTFRKLKIALLIVAVSLASLFVAYTNAAARNSVINSQDVAPNDLQIETRPRECQLQGEDEKCVSAIGVGKRATLNFELYYKVHREVGGYQIASSTWVVDLDCEAKTVSASQLKFFDSNNFEVELPTENMENALVGIQSDYEAALNEC